jgi:hypothetical protein
MVWISLTLPGLPCPCQLLRYVKADPPILRLSKAFIEYIRTKWFLFVATINDYDMIFLSIRVS